MLLLREIKLLTPYRRQGCHPLDPAAQPGHIQCGLEHFQKWGIHSFSGQTLGLLWCSASAPSQQRISSWSLLFQFKAITPCSITTHPCRSSFPGFLLPLQVLKGCYRVCPEPSTLQAKFNSLSLSSWERYSSSPVVFMALLCTCSDRVLLSLGWQSQSWAEYSRWGEKSRKMWKCSI